MPHSLQNRITIYLSIGFNNFLKPNLWFYYFSGWVGEIDIKDQLSQVEIETETEFGNKDNIASM